jgi:tripartite-type tricarboxylate transporter receptor subunit TctC
MKLPHRRQFLHLAAGATALPAVSRLARAQAYPSRPVRIVVGFPPGGGTDIAARLIGQWLSERLGQQFVIENRPGAGSNIATEAVVRASADGYTLLLVNAAHAINATLYDKLNYNFLRDFAPVAGIIRVPNVMEVNPSLPPKSVSEIIAYAKANPGKVSYASGGNGTAQHLTGELFKMMTGVVMVHVPYRGDAPALTDLIGGQVQVMFGSIPPSVEHIRAGKLRALAVTTATPRHLHETERQVFLDREPGKDPAILRHEADAETADAVGGGAVNPLSVEPDLAAAGADPAGDGLDHRGLADAVAAEHPQHLARPHRQADALHDVAGAVMSVQVRDLEHGQACPK